MQIKNSIPYVLKPLGLTLEALTEKLESKSFKPCHATQEASLGWEPMWRNGPLALEFNNAFFVKLRLEKRLLPSSVINELLKEKCDEFFDAEGYHPSRKIRMQMKDDMTQSLLPKAFKSSKYVYLIIDEGRNFLHVVTASDKTADDATAFLRETLNGLPAALVSPKKSIPNVMRDWLADPVGMPEYFSLGERVDLIDSDGAKIRFSNQDLLTDELGVHLDAGKQPERLALCFREATSFSMTDSFKILQVKQLLDAEADSFDYDSEASRFTHEMSVSFISLCDLFDYCLQAFGGLDDALAASMERSLNA